MSNAASPLSNAAAQPRPAPKLYRVTLDIGAVGVLGHCLRDVITTVTELYPGHVILSALVAPEWTD
jgi:hypothetical protein